MDQKEKKGSNRKNGSKAGCGDLTLYQCGAKRVFVENPSGSK